MPELNNSRGGYDVFVSYSHRDISQVEQIIETIREKSDKKIWFDKNLRGGENYFSIIADQILKNEFFVFMVSKNSAFSDWCERELQFAASEKKKIIAIWLEDTDLPPGVKIVINNTHYINRYDVPQRILDEEFGKIFNFADASGAADSNREQNSDPSSQREAEDIFFARSDLKILNNLLVAEKNGNYSRCFRPENAKLLGMAYHYGINVPEDPVKASLYYKAALHQDDPDAKFLYALLHNKNKTQLLAAALEAADNGGSTAMVWLGNAYFDGKMGVYTDKSKAFLYYLSAAKKGNVLGMYHAGYEYRVGKRTAVDYELAYMYFLRTMEAGFPKSYRHLALMYKNGEYFTQNYEKAVEMFELAIKHGDYLSYYFMGDLYGQQLNQPDKRKELYEKAVECADRNLIRSGIPYYEYAEYFYKDKNDPQILEKAVQYYLKSAQRGYGSALYIAVYYIMKMKDPQRMQYLQQAFEYNCDEAAYELGRIEKQAAGQSTDGLPEKALWYFEKGAENGDIACVRELIFNYGTVFTDKKETTRQDRNNAIKWYNFLFTFDEDRVKKAMGNNMPLIYYGYAIELDYDTFTHNPDKKLALFYFDKALAGNIKLIKQCSSFVEGVRLPEESHSGMEKDILHAEDLANIIDKYLPEYLDSETSDKIEYSDTRKTVLKRLYKVYLILFECYSKGNLVEKNKEKAKYYRNKWADIAAKLKIY